MAQREDLSSHDLGATLMWVGKHNGTHLDSLENGHVQWLLTKYEEGNPPAANVTKHYSLPLSIPKAFLLTESL